MIQFSLISGSIFIFDTKKKAFSILLRNEFIYPVDMVVVNETFNLFLSTPS